MSEFLDFRQEKQLRHWQASVHTQYNIYLGIKCLSSVWLAVFL